MHKILVTSLAAATILSGAALGNYARAMTVLTPNLAAHASLIQQATVVCGGAGCVPVQTKSLKRRPLRHI